MSKYDPLGRHLKKVAKPRVPMTFSEIERVLGFQLPNSKRYRAWWSNNPFNSVMTNVWLEAGYRTEQVDMAKEQVLFVRQSAENGTSAPSTSSDAAGGHPAWGALRGSTVLASGVDLTEPAEPAWENLYDQ